jgi:putative endonuclease
MMRQRTGDLGEKLAAEFITQRGYRILETGFRVKEGEADIIAMDEECLVFVEVRTKTSRIYGSPEESITPTKKAHLIAVANRYIETLTEPPTNWRIDLIAIEMNKAGKIRRMNLIKNAVEET